MDSEQFKQEAEKIEQSLSALRVAERNAVIPFMNGDFTQWDLYLASSSEYAMRLIDGFISMLGSRNLVCVAQLLRAQVGVCLRTFALFAAEDQDDFLPKGCQVPWRERWGSHHSAWIHPDAHRSRRFQRSRISRAGNRRGQATPYSYRRRSRLCWGFCRKLPLRILNPRQDFVLGIDANCLPFLMFKFWGAFHNAEWDPWTVGSRGGPL